MRQTPAPAGPVVLVGDHALTARAAEFAFAEVSVRGVDLVVLATTKTRKASRHHEFTHASSSLGEKYPDVSLHYACVRCGIRRALVKASAESQLAVVDAQDRDGLRGGLAGMLGNSVSRATLRRSDCPVTVICGRGR
ncbi:conserved hypothetical protein [Streptomyces sviceus ATCC 29083]|uniref:UspA domain-containing protein n=1 Tax=Streptomyces sviceus (strain ATCC 29083 / DSM 924 / JCM 4929 / NBRC 13980 / NCIMB 11184 / NRRL 5439 / UC 5370) TaxID=463191 RepID=B5I3E7_STRX2|nr:conserved hypothetical protein [Streptomyces sviceus ATCC 29083]